LDPPRFRENLDVISAFGIPIVAAGTAETLIGESPCVLRQASV